MGGKLAKILMIKFDYLKGIGEDELATATNVAGTEGIGRIGGKFIRLLKNGIITIEELTQFSIFAFCIPRQSSTKISNVFFFVASFFVI